MSRGEFSDADANAAAMAELHLKTDAERAKEKAAAEALLARPVKITLGELREILRALADASDFASRQSVQKEYGVRTAAINIVARNKPLLDKLNKLESATAAKRAGRRVQSRARKAPD